MSDSTTDCPAWCSGKHTVHGWGTTHRGNVSEVPLPGDAPGSLLSVIRVAGTELSLNADAHYYLEASGPQIAVYGWGKAYMVFDLRDAERVAELHKQLGNADLADAIAKTAAAMNGEAG